MGRIENPNAWNEYLTKKYFDFNAGTRHSSFPEEYLHIEPTISKALRNLDVPPCAFNCCKGGTQRYFPRKRLKAVIRKNTLEWVASLRVGNTY